MSDQSQKFEAGCIVELFGHTRIAGLVGEQNIGGQTFVRLDVPEIQREAVRWIDDKRESVLETIAAFTKFIGANAIYSITPTTEAIARAVAQNIATRPIAQFDLPQLKAINAPSAEGDGEVDDDNDEELNF